MPAGSYAHRMIDALSNQPAAFFFVVILVLSLLALAGGYWTAARGNHEGNERDENAFGLGQTAIFGLIVLILAFSFSFAAERFETRRALVVTEAESVGDVFDQSDYLPLKQRLVVKDLMRRYTAARVELIEGSDESWDDQVSGAKSHDLYQRIWDIGAADVRSDPKNVAYLQWSQNVDEMGDNAEFQLAAVNNHLPMPILGIVVLSTLVGAGLLGLTFGRVQSPNRVLSVIFCVLFAATVFTIVDMDHPSGGLLKIDVAPLSNTLSDFKH